MEPAMAQRVTSCAMQDPAVLERRKRPETQMETIVWTMT
jgi:hypothetical protein